MLPPLQTANPRRRLSGGFIAVIVFKYLKAAAFLLVGLAVLRFEHVARRDPSMVFARFLNANPERESIQRLSQFFEEITPGQRRAIGAAALAIGSIFLAEASFLLARIWWATYFTIFLTLLGIPLELIDIWRKPYHLRGWYFLIINVAILVFLWRRRNEFRDQLRETPETPTT
ncbi:MAG TPA: DUF2127 domain-containing protein [Thermoanaerobaculia bacterium]|nr:DUF2127 domain-containing protein [Thermoanaerobaculia bacterium]